MRGAASTSWNWLAPASGAARLDFFFLGFFPSSPPPMNIYAARPARPRTPRTTRTHAQDGKPPPLLSPGTTAAGTVAGVKLVPLAVVSMAKVVVGMGGKAVAAFEVLVAFVAVQSLGAEITVSFVGRSSRSPRRLLPLPQPVA